MVACTTPKTANAPFKQTPAVQVDILPFSGGWDHMPSGAYRFPNASYILNDSSTIAKTVGFTAGLVASYWGSIGDFAEQAINTGINKSKASSLLDVFNHNVSQALYHELERDMTDGTSTSKLLIRPYGELTMPEKGAINLIYIADAKLYDANKSMIWERNFRVTVGQKTMKEWQKPNTVTDALNEAMTIMAEQITAELKPIKLLSK